MSQVDLGRILPPRVSFRDGYRVVHVRGRRVLEHRLIWELVHGPIPPRMVIHHLNHRRDDNRLENLRMMHDTEHASLHSATGSWADAEVRKQRRIEVLKRLGLCFKCKDQEIWEPTTLCASCYCKRSNRSQALYAARKNDPSARMSLPCRMWQMGKQVLLRIRDIDKAKKAMDESGSRMSRRHLAAIAAHERIELTARGGSR